MTMQDTPEIVTTPQQVAKEQFRNAWKLETKNGRQVWQFSSLEKVSNEYWKDMAAAFKFDKTKNTNSGDTINRSQAIAKQYKAFRPEEIEIPSEFHETISKDVFIAAAKGLNFYQALQTEEGHWPGDYAGPLFLMPGLIIAAYVTQTPFPKAHQELMKRYMLNHQNDDGGWGLHIEGESTMFGTVMQYVALRILGESIDNQQVILAKRWIQNNRGVQGIPPWGKFYLSILGVYEWEGNNSLLPEMWLLPESLPLHPSRYWCHSRMVYLPMGYCYGHKVTGETTPLIKELREELYTENYATIDWRIFRDEIAESDIYSKPSFFLKLLNRFIINPYERVHVKLWRKKALDFTLEYIRAEDEQTNYVNIGPVNQIINSICIWHAYGKDSPQFQKHVDRWQDYLWVAEDGMKMNGYNGSQLWDTTFALQAILEGEFEKYYPEVVQKAYSYIETTQVRENVKNRNRFFRHISKGGWPFSTIDHGWPISDCTAEGMSAVIKAHQSSFFGDAEKSITADRLYDAVNVILSFQNKDGGWATYENTRSGSWLEKLNPSGIFKDIMIDYSYTECTSACVRALCEFREEYPDHRAEEINQAIDKGVAFIKSKQLADGSWIGSWAVCFTYGTWFGVEGLVAAGENTYGAKSGASLSIKKACAFLLSKQNEDGGWGESYESCVKQQYVQHETSQVVQTSWALLALLAAAYPDKKLIEKGIRFLLSKQQPNGDWLQENISGVFNANCMITYTAYRNVFPLWALGRYLKMWN